MTDGVTGETPKWLMSQGGNKVVKPKFDDVAVKIPPNASAVPGDMKPQQISEKDVPTMGLSLSKGNLNELQQRNAADKAMREKAAKLKNDTRFQPNLRASMSAMFPSFNRTENNFQVPPPTPDTTVSNVLGNAANAPQLAPTMSMTGRAVMPQLMQTASIIPLDVASLDDLANYIYPHTLAVRRLVEIIKKANVQMPNQVRDPGLYTEITLTFQHGTSVEQGSKVYRVYVESPPVTIERMHLDQQGGAPRVPAPPMLNQEAPLAIWIEVTIPDPVSRTRKTYKVMYDDVLAEKDVPTSDLAETAANAARPAVPIRRTPHFRTMAADTSDDIKSSFLRTHALPTWAIILLVLGVFTLGFFVGFFSKS